MLMQYFYRLRFFSLIAILWLTLFRDDCAAVRTVYITVHDVAAISPTSPVMATSIGIDRQTTGTDEVYYFIGADGLTVFLDGRVPTVSAVTTETTTVVVSPVAVGQPTTTHTTARRTVTRTATRTTTRASPLPTQKMPKKTSSSQPQFQGWDATGWRHVTADDESLSTSTLYITGPPTIITQMLRFANQTDLTMSTATTSALSSGQLLETSSESASTTTLYITGPPITITQTLMFANQTHLLSMSTATSLVLSSSKKMTSPGGVD